LASEDDIVEAVLGKFEALPARCKPQNRGNGNQEWVPLSGIVITRGTTSYQCSMRRTFLIRSFRKDDDEPTCISLA
jgi:hypothetical protein